MTELSFTRLKREPDQPWGVRVPRPSNLDTGDTVEVKKRDGSTSKAVLGNEVATFPDASLYTIRDEAPKGARKETPDVTEPGVYETKDGEVYVVKPNQERTALYAKRLVELRDSQGDRINDEDGHVRIDFEYESGAIYKLAPEDKMPLERAKKLTVRYGRCIVCGRWLKVAESVERGIGPVCIKGFAA